LAIREKALGTEHPTVAQTLEHYAYLLRRTGRDAEARRLELTADLLKMAWKGQSALVEVLLSMDDVDVNSKNSIGQTALMMAAAGGDTTTVTTLLEAGADVSAKDNDGSTALMTAEEVGHTEIVELLKKAGAKE